LVLTLAGVLAAGVVLIAFVVLRVTGQLVAQEEGRFGQAILDVSISQLAREYDSSKSPTNPGNYDALERMARGLARLPDVEEVVVVGPSLRSVVAVPAHKRRLRPDPALAAAVNRGERTQRYGKSEQGQRRVFVYTPLHPGRRSAGAVRLALRPGALGARVAQAQNIILFYLVVNVLILLLVGGYLLDRWMVRPVRRLTEATERVATGELTAYVDVQGEDALARLSKAFNRMVDRLARSRSEVERRLVELEAVNVELKTARDTVVRGEKLASVGTLAAGVAHEVGNPLAAILGYVEMLQSSTESDDDRDILDRVHKEVLRINDIIRELLAYSRPSPEEAFGSVAVAIDSVTSLVAPQPRMRDVEVEADVAEGLPAVSLSEAKLQQVLLNLCLNAADAMPDGGRLRVAACEAEGSDRVEITVSDEGTGIAPEALAQVFDPFFTTKEPGSGTGLGLSIVDRILTDHGARIEVRSTQGAGTTFVISLPVHVHTPAPESPTEAGG
jgi:signal transduction histidine kinase